MFQYTSKYIPQPRILWYLLLMSSASLNKEEFWPSDHTGAFVSINKHILYRFLQKICRTLLVYECIGPAFTGPLRRAVGGPLLSHMQIGSFLVLLRRILNILPQHCE